VAEADAYVGSELEVFAEAERWKSYWSAHVAPHLRGDVLEVGAGIGSNTRVLREAGQGRWVCLEPDGTLAARIREAVRSGLIQPPCEVQKGTLADLDPVPAFDAVLYLDVLEHIEDDHGEVVRAAGLLRPGGALVVLAPAWPWLFSEFDHAIGHYRRYTRHALVRLAPPGLVREQLIMLDCLGLLASAANKLLLRRSQPTRANIRFWDRILVRGSRRMDPLLRYRLGRSLLAVWRRPRAAQQLESAAATKAV
jgi:SAM-dependent methyltransferase